MIKDLQKNKFDYALLALLAIIFLSFFFHFAYQPLKMFLSVVGFSLSYWLWGLFHHLKLGKFSLKIVLEYTLLALLAIVLASTLLI